MGATPIVSHVYRETVEHFGEPDSVITFDDPPPPDDSWPARIDVLIWEDDSEVDITTFATVGMCDRPMQHAEHRAEMHFSIRHPAKQMDLNSVAHFMANLCVYPFANKTFFDWVQTINSPRPIPYFPSCRGLLLHPAFVEDGWDTIQFNETRINIMNAVPITEAEMQHGHDNGPFSIFDYFAELQLDLFVDRNPE